jgi:muramoyltetrapeptide carboxypeptidase
VASDESYAELHGFAARIGIPGRGFDRDHYDVPAVLYDQVVAAGARPVTSRELVSRLSAAGLRRRKATHLGRRALGQPLLAPRRLRRGDRVAVVAPAGPAAPAAVERGVAVLASWGLDVRIGAFVFAGGASPHLAATDEQRAADLQLAWCDPQIAAVVCARGGYGCQRIVDLLDWPALMEAGPSVLVGFSDVTALHQAFARVLGVVTLHGPVATSLGAGDRASREHLRRTLFEPQSALDLLNGSPVSTVVGGVASGVLVGGNLTVLAADAGTSTSRPATGGIALLEDECEAPYRIDRLLTQLRRTGWFDGVHGVVLGSFTRCEPAVAVRAVVGDRLGDLGVPVLAGVPVGHGGTNLTVALGSPARLDADAGELVLRRPALT